MTEIIFKDRTSQRLVHNEYTIPSNKTYIYSFNITPN